VIVAQQANKTKHHYWPLDVFTRKNCWELGCVWMWNIKFHL